MLDLIDMLNSSGYLFHNNNWSEISEEFQKPMIWQLSKGKKTIAFSVEIFCKATVCSHFAAVLTFGGRLVKCGDTGITNCIYSHRRRALRRVANPADQAGYFSRTQYIRFFSGMRKATKRTSRPCKFISIVSNG